MMDLNDLEVDDVVDITVLDSEIPVLQVITEVDSLRVESQDFIIRLGSGRLGYGIVDVQRHTGPVVKHDELIHACTPSDARRIAQEIGEAADEAETPDEAAGKADRLPDGIYRVTLPDYTSGASQYRKVKDGAVFTPAGYKSPGNWTIHERIGDIP